MSNDAPHLIGRVPHETVGDVVKNWAQQAPQIAALRFLKSGTIVDELTNAELDERVDAVASVLIERLNPGDRALLLFRPGLDFVAAFVACQRAGIVAVPTMLPGPHEGARRLSAIIDDCQPSAVLSHEEARAALNRHSMACPVIEIDQIGSRQKYSELAPRRYELAMLQYTSGSTGTPKGVMIRHQNLMSNINLLISRLQVNDTDVTVSWLPHYHDMGLVGPILTFLVAGRPSVLMAPADFLRKPLSWLNAISRFKASIVVAPTFAFELCGRRLSEVPESDRDTALDLSSMRVAIVGAEMIRASALNRFTSAAAPYGFLSNAIYPSYGLAESTLFVDGIRGPVARVTRRFAAEALSQGHVELSASHNARGDTKALVASGTGAEQDGTMLVVTKPGTGKVALPGMVGEICISGPSVAAGYWGRGSENEKFFRAHIDGAPGRDFLRTGDLGFVHDGLLFIAGRQDDLIILNGVNYYPHDIEESSSLAHPDVRGCRAAAVAIDAEDGKRLIIMQEMRRRRPTDVEQDTIVAAIRQTVYESCGIAVHDVVLVPPGKLPSTTSGKIRRRKCRDLYQAQDLPSSWLRPDSHRIRTPPSSLDAVPERPPEMSLHLDVFRGIMSEVLECPVGNIDVKLPITAYPLDSLKLVELIFLSEARLGWQLSVEQLLAAKSLIDLAVQSDDFVPLSAGQLWADAALPATIQPAGGEFEPIGDVILTGATGMLGIRILAELIHTSDRAIRCLVRGPEHDAFDRLAVHLAELGISSDLAQQRVTCISVDLSKLDLGLTDRQYETLATRSAIIIHSAALLDFIRPYAALRPINVEGTRAMITLAGSHRRKYLAHISSISVLETPLKAGQTLAEQEPLDYPETLATGYAQTKWVSDVMVGRARDRGLPASIFRVPWLLDMPHGDRPLPDGFLLRFFASCVDLGCIPETKARFNIVSAEFAAKSIAALALAPAGAPLTYHLGAERDLDASELRTILEAGGVPIAMAPTEQWAEQLNGKIRTVADYPLRPFASLFTQNDERPLKIDPYLAGRIPTMDSTATARMLAQRGLETIPNTLNIQRLVASVWNSRLAEKTQVRQTHLGAGATD